ncbi:hypothetical protein GA0115252_156723 [Streptomyces sp. DfronAA-171]|nr:hypothetical protein GA0115252_156723 [Streptomyces sp. DfronAA-171]
MPRSHDAATPRRRAATPGRHLAGPVPGPRHLWGDVALGGQLARGHAWGLPGGVPAQGVLPSRRDVRGHGASGRTGLPRSRLDAAVRARTAQGALGSPRFRGRVPSPRWGVPLRAVPQGARPAGRRRLRGHGVAGRTASPRPALTSPYRPPGRRRPGWPPSPEAASRRRASGLPLGAVPEGTPPLVRPRPRGHGVAGGTASPRPASAPPCEAVPVRWSPGRRPEHAVTIASKPLHSGRVRGRTACSGQGAPRPEATA